MPWRLIGVLLIIALLILFSGFNAHKITINFGFFSLNDIHLFVALVSAFILGAFTALPFSIIKSFKRKNKIKKEALLKEKKKKEITGKVSPENEISGTEGQEQPNIQEPGEDHLVVPPPPVKEKKTRKKTKKK
jgi:uncharacterized integral membrane protein